MNQSRFDSYRDRGTAFHEAIEPWWWNGETPKVKEVQPWIDSFVAYKNLENWRVIATELKMVDRFYKIAGTADLIIQHKRNNRIALCDYKTKEEKFSKQNHRAQMGGYLSLMQCAYPNFHIDTVIIYWITPKETTSNNYDVLDCLKRYEQARNDYFSKQNTF